MKEVITKHLTTNELAERWGLHPGTLENWRSLGGGPKFLKIGRKVVYRIEEIEKFEAAQLKKNTAS